MFLKARISSLDFPLNDTIAKTGTSNADSPSTNVSRKTIGDCLSNFLTTLLRIYSPIIEATAHHPPIQSPYGILSVPKTMYVMLEPAVENMIIYIPVEDATAGGTPMLRSKGLKIAPPPRPRAPETQPPSRAKITNLIRMLC